MRLIPLEKTTRRVVELPGPVRLGPKKAHGDFGTGKQLQGRLRGARLSNIFGARHVPDEYRCSQVRVPCAEVLEGKCMLPHWACSRTCNLPTCAIACEQGHIMPFKGGLQALVCWNCFTCIRSGG